VNDTPLRNQVPIPDPDVLSPADPNDRDTASTGRELNSVRRSVEDASSVTPDACGRAGQKLDFVRLRNELDIQIR
jgi:hypothetical protein